MFELVIFDCDGVLVDSERLANKVDVLVLRQLGLELSEAEIIERFVGTSDIGFRKGIESLLGHALPDDWEAEIEPLYREAFGRDLVPVAGIREALDRISQPTCVASSGSHDKIRFTLGMTGLYSRFEGRIFSATEVKRGKPAPDLLLHAAERMGVPPRACAVVEDSALGAAAGRAAGMRVFAFSGSVTPAEKLEGPQTVVFEQRWSICQICSTRLAPEIFSRSRSAPNGNPSHEDFVVKNLLFLLFVVGAAAALAQVPRRGYVLQAGEGESACCGILIKASPRSGTQGGVMALQPMPADFSTGVHFHEEADEFFFVVSGTGVATISGQEHEVGPGDVIFVPAGEDHKIATRDAPMELLEFLDRPGLDEEFRTEIEGPLTLERLNEVANRFGTVYKTLE